MLDTFLENIKMTFGDPNRAHTARAQLHELKMVPGIMAEDYTAQFKMLMSRIGFNNAVLEDICPGSPQFIFAVEIVIPLAQLSLKVVASTWLFSWKTES